VTDRDSRDSLDSVRLVMLQFSFSNPKVVPLFIKRQKRENEKEIIRKNEVLGTQIIEPTAKVSLRFFLSYLEKTGYEMVDGFYQARLDKNNRPYHMVRFIFVRRQYVVISEEFRQVRDVLRAELQEISQIALWRIRVFLNPFFKNGEEIPGQYALSINLEMRQPLFHPDGQAMMVWPKDEEGKRTGKEPLPLNPDHYLCIKDNCLQLVRG